MLAPPPDTVPPRDLATFGKARAIGYPGFIGSARPSGRIHSEERR